MSSDTFRAFAYLFKGCSECAPPTHRNDRARLGYHLFVGRDRAHPCQCKVNILRQQILPQFGLKEYELDSRGIYVKFGPDVNDALDLFRALESCAISSLRTSRFQAFHGTHDLSFKPQLGDGVEDAYKNELSRRSLAGASSTLAGAPFSLPEGPSSTASAAASPMADTSSVRTASSGSRKPVCRICKIVTPVDSKILYRCAGCRGYYHRRCDRGTDSSRQNPEWRCQKCLRKAASPMSAGVSHKPVNSPQIVASTPIAGQNHIIGASDNTIARGSEDAASVRGGTTLDPSGGIVSNDGHSSPLKGYSTNRPGPLHATTARAVELGEGLSDPTTSPAPSTSKPSTLLSDQPARPDEATLDKQRDKGIPKASKMPAPDYTYRHMSEMAIMDSEEPLTMSGIVKWIVNHIPHYKDKEKDPKLRSGISNTISIYHRGDNNNLMEYESADNTKVSTYKQYGRRPGREHLLARWDRERMCMIHPSSPHPPPQQKSSKPRKHARDPDDMVEHQSKRIRSGTETAKPNGVSSRHSADRLPGLGSRRPEQTQSLNNRPSQLSDIHVVAQVMPLWQSKPSEETETNAHQSLQLSKIRMIDHLCPIHLKRLNPKPQKLKLSDIRTLNEALPIEPQSNVVETVETAAPCSSMSMIHIVAESAPDSQPIYTFSKFVTLIKEQPWAPSSSHQPDSARQDVYPRAQTDRPLEIAASDRPSSSLPTSADRLQVMELEESAEETQQINDAIADLMPPPAPPQESTAERLAAFRKKIDAQVLENIRSGRAITHKQYPLGDFAKLAPKRDVPLEEIKARKTRKQHIGTPTCMSRLGHNNALVRYNLICEALTRNDGDDDEAESEAGNNLYGVAEPDLEGGGEPEVFPNIEALVGTPKVVLPIIYEGQLVFTDGTKNARGRSNRATKIYRIGEAARMR